MLGMQTLFGQDTYCLMIIINEYHFIEDILNLKFSKIFVWIFAPIFIFLTFKFLFKINKTTIINLLFNFIVWKSRKEKKISNSDTHQQIIKNKDTYST